MVIRGTISLMNCRYVLERYFLLEISLWVDERYQLSSIIFSHVTAKKNVHFRPGIIHFLISREVDVLFNFKLLLFEAYPDGRKVVMNMPRMSKQKKEEWGFFLDENGRITYNELCRKCDRECKQSFRAVIISCPEYNSKRRKQKKWFAITTLLVRRCGLFYCSGVGTGRKSRPR